MPDPIGVAPDADAEKLGALRLTRLAATLSLAACIVIFAIARFYRSRYPWLDYVAAFFEAAAIGGLADWYAVVALFRRPLGLPIPHTAIIPSNQVRIADNLGRFIEVNFLAPGPVREKLNEVDFAALVADWLADPERSAGLSSFVRRLVPRTLDAVEGSDLRSFIGDRIGEQVERIPLAPLAAGLLTAFTADRRHQRLFDQLVELLGNFINDEAALTALRARIREELPSLFNLFRADAYLLKKIVGSAGGLLDEIRSDPDHPIRAEFDRFVQGFIDNLRNSPEYAERVERLKHDLLARPELRDIAETMWKSLRRIIEDDVARSDSAIGRHLAGLFVEVGRQLASDPRVRRDMNVGFVVALATFIEQQKSGVSTFIADQVKRWDLAQLTRLIELNIGRDLQYIRFNGMIVGGLAGLALHIGERMLMAN